MDEFHVKAGRRQKQDSWHYLFDEKVQSVSGKILLSFFVAKFAVASTANSYPS